MYSRAPLAPSWGGPGGLTRSGKGGTNGMTAQKTSPYCLLKRCQCRVTGTHRHTHANGDVVTCSRRQPNPWCEGVSAQNVSRNGKCIETSSRCRANKLVHAFPCRYNYNRKSPCRMRGGWGGREPNQYCFLGFSDELL